MIGPLSNRQTGSRRSIREFSVRWVRLPYPSWAIVILLIIINLKMILFTKPSKPFTYTGKETPRRHAILREYEPEIDELYASMDGATNLKSSIVPPKEWDISSTLTFVQAVVHDVMVNKVGDNDDLFEYGCDRFVSLFTFPSIVLLLIQLL
jgi:hypothetical protein